MADSIKFEIENKEAYVDTKGIVHSRKSLNEIIDKLIGIELYSNETGTNGDISLNDDAENYEYFELFYRDNNSIYGGSTKIFSPNNKYFEISMIEATKTSATYIRRARYITTNSTMTLINKGYINLNGSAIRYDLTTNYLYIFKIIGYKK